jgi:hypothetical protein
LSNEETFKAWVAEKINNKEFSGHYNHVRSRTFGKKGRETWINGRTGSASINVTSEGSGMDQHYVARITLPVESNYERKTFIGVGSEYRKEGWETKYNYHVTYRRGVMTNRLEGESITDHSTAADHDAVEWSHDQLKDDVISNLVAS